MDSTGGSPPGAVLRDLFFYSDKVDSSDRGLVSRLARDLGCPDCTRVFHKPFAMRQHRASLHGKVAVDVRAEYGNELPVVDLGRRTSPRIRYALHALTFVQIVDAVSVIAALRAGPWN